MMKQIWRRTKGLRELPGGITSLGDARALKELSKQIDTKEVPVKITPEIRKALDGLGFTKVTEGTINRMRDKYSIKNGKAQSRVYRLRRPVDPSIVANKFQRTQRREMQSGNMLKRTGEDLHQLVQQANQDPSLARFYRKKLKGSVITLDNPLDSYSVSRLRDNANTLPELSLKKAWDTSVYPVRAKDLKGINRPGGEMIAVGDKSPRAITLHEMGHNKSARDFGGYGKTPDDFYRYRAGKAIIGEGGIHDLAEENMASAYALNVLRNQPGVGKDKELLNKAMSTYTLSLRRALGR